MTKKPRYVSEWSERALVGAVLREPSVLAAVDLAPGDFGDLRYRAIWAAMGELQCQGKRPTVSLVIGALERTGEVAALGGPLAVAAISDEVLSTEAAVLEHHAQEVRRHSVTRGVFAMASDLRERAERGAEGAELVEWCADTLRNLNAAGGLSARSETLYELTEAVRADLASDEPETRGSGFTRIGVPEFDRAVGGYPRGVVTIVAGKTAHGKSSLLLQGAEAEAQSGGCVVWLSAEDLRRDTAARALGHCADIPASELRRGRSALQPRRKSTLKRIETPEHLRRILVVPAIGLDARALVARVRLLQASNPVTSVVYDYLNRIPVPRGGDRFSAQIESMNVFDDAAKGDDCSWIIGSQFRKTEYDEPRLEDLRGASEVSDIAKFILFLHRPRKGEVDDNEIKIWTPKASNDGHVEGRFEWDGPLMRVGSRIREAPL